MLSRFSKMTVMRAQLLIIVVVLSSIMYMIFPWFEGGSVDFSSMSEFFLEFLMIAMIVSSIAIFALSLIHGYETERGTICFNPNSPLCKFLNLKSGKSLCQSYWIVTLPFFIFLVAIYLSGYILVSGSKRLLEYVMEYGFLETISIFMGSISQFSSEIYGSIDVTSPQSLLFLVVLAFIILTFKMCGPQNGLLLSLSGIIFIGLSLMFYETNIDIAQREGLTILQAFLKSGFEILKIFVISIAVMALAWGIIFCAYSIFPVLRNSFLGQIIANFTKGLCPVLEECK